MACGPLGLDRIEVAPNGALTATPMSATPASACLSLGYAEGLFFDEHAYLNHVLRGRVTPLDETPRLELRRSGGPTTTRGRSDASGVLLSHSEGVDVIEPSLLGWADGYEVVREVRQGRAALSAVGTADRLLVAWEDGRVGIPDGRSAEGLGGPRFVAGYPYDEPDEVLAIGPETAAPLRWERDEVAELPFTLPSVVGGSRGDTLQWTEDCRVVAQIVATDDGWRVRYTALRSAGAVSVGVGAGAGAGSGAAGAAHTPLTQAWPTGQSVAVEQEPSFFCLQARRGTSRSSSSAAGVPRPAQRALGAAGFAVLGSLGSSRSPSMTQKGTRL